MKKLLLLILINAIIYTTTSAQRIPYVAPEYASSELLVRLKPNHSIQNLLHRHETKKGIATDLKIKNVISEELGMYVLQFTNKSIHLNDLQRDLFNSKEVFQVQKNHKISYRATTPNDSRFNQQWQYINTGQNGGTADADLDIELAWDMTTGGVTPQGDEIVVCVIDDGADLDHPDWGDNLWVNTQEIANNGVDDDGNGFTDDRRGWNADAGNDNVDENANNFNGSHGTPVAGIIGAQGNNGVGVSGVSWNVKVMIVLGGGDEADALAAYAYPHKMRQMYNETNGQKGAFVVATNASWGIDFGQASSSPLWCDFYNDLGEVGILNAGATINDDVNVDQDGDLPTTCTSEYLIGVTNLRRTDVKEQFAGYGSTHIDLGAYGEETYTLAWQGGYDGFGGTSGATPHVAGTIGLMYAANCNSFATLSKSNPGAAALAVRQYILGSVDSNNSLQSITATGGRLNTHKAMQALMNDCTTALAVELTDFSAQQVKDKIAIQWEVEWATGGSRFDLYRSTDGENWSLLHQSTVETTTHKAQQYEIWDTKIQIGQLYYRLDQLEEDGTLSQQHTATVVVKGNETMPSIYPNPISLGQLQIINAQNVTQVDILDLQGKLVWSTAVNSVTLLRKSFVLPQELNGVYFVRLTTTTGILVRKIVIQ